MPSKQQIPDNIDNIDILDVYGQQQDKKKKQKKSSGTKKQQQEVLISEDEIYNQQDKKKKQKKSSGTKKQKPEDQDILVSEDEIFRNPTIENPVKHNLYSSVYDGSWFIVLAAIGIPATIIGLMVTGSRRK
jgi:hypothetical protein